MSSGKLNDLLVNHLQESCTQHDYVRVVQARFPQVQLILSLVDLGYHHGGDINITLACIPRVQSQEAVALVVLRLSTPWVTRGLSLEHSGSRAKGSSFGGMREITAGRVEVLDLANRELVFTSSIWRVASVGEKVAELTLILENSRDFQQRSKNDS